MSELPTKAVILARGLGMRMRAETGGVDLTAEQERVASAGIKALVPVANGKTLLELIVENLVAAGFSDIWLVIGPEHDAIREYCSAKCISVSFATQIDPKGTADAVLVAETFVGADELFLVVNSDNLYPIESLRRLRETARPSMLAFAREALIGRSNIGAERIAKFATVEIDADGLLRTVVEKPEQIEADSFVSMNAWLFSTAIFEACRSIELSKRGEYEITTAVQYAIDTLGVEFTAVKTGEGVLDLSSRSDIESVSLFLTDK
ncbi:MAG: sugar phosphate nucleotidyltransferase [Pyrinomonadaceae bacterium]